MQRCGRRGVDEDDWCGYPAEHEVVASTIEEEVPVGLRLCDPCGSNLSRRRLVELVPLSG